MDEEPRGVRRTDVVNLWMTDAVFMPNCRKMAIATSGRDIRFVDATPTNLHVETILYSKGLNVFCNLMSYNYMHIHTVIALASAPCKGGICTCISTTDPSFYRGRLLER